MKNIKIGRAHLPFYIILFGVLISCATVSTTVTMRGTLSPVIFTSTTPDGQIREKFSGVVQHIVAETENTSDSHQDPPSKFDRIIDGKRLRGNDYVACSSIEYFTRHHFYMTATDDESRITINCSVVSE